MLGSGALTACSVNPRSDRLRAERAATRIALFGAMLFPVCGASCARNRAVGTAVGARTMNPWSVPKSIADSARSEQLAPGVVLHHFVNRAAPWRADVLDVDLEACVAVRSVKGAATAVGRTTTSALLASLTETDAPLAAVNADFFLTGGVPVGALTQGGTLIAGPGDRPVFAMNRVGRPWIGNMTSDGRLTTPTSRVTLETWNRPSARVPGVVDANWGVPLDSLSRRSAWILAPVGRDSAGPRYQARPAVGVEPLLARGDTLLLVGMSSNAVVAGTLSAGDTVRVRRMLRPFQPREVVGGFPVIVRDSAVPASVDSAGAIGFRGLNPRTVVGYAAEGRRLLFAVIDGRQPGYSMGMTVRQTGEFLLALGAREALNLDGGGSSAMVVRTADGTSRVVNHPSDSTGERTVGDAVALLRTCPVPQ